MRTWLDHKCFTPETFRYSFGPTRVVFQIDFAIEAEAAAFAMAFSGRIIA